MKLPLLLRLDEPIFGSITIIQGFVLLVGIVVTGIADYFISVIETYLIVGIGLAGTFGFMYKVRPKTPYKRTEDYTQEDIEAAQKTLHTKLAEVEAQVEERKRNGFKPDPKLNTAVENLRKLVSNMPK